MKNKFDFPFGLVDYHACPQKYISLHGIGQA
jgi:hypothetical protein